MGGEEGAEFWWMSSGIRVRERVRHWTLKGGNHQCNCFSTADHRSGVFGHCEDWQDQMQEKRDKESFLSSAKQQAEKGLLWGSSEKASRPSMGNKHPQTESWGQQMPSLKAT